MNLLFQLEQILKPGPIEKRRLPYKPRLRLIFGADRSPQWWVCIGPDGMCAGGFTPEIAYHSLRLTGGAQHIDDVMARKQGGV